MDVPFWIWMAVLGFIVVTLAIDLFAHRRAHVISVREAATWSAICRLRRRLRRPDLAGLGCRVRPAVLRRLPDRESLAVDNVFVWAIIFTWFAVPAQFQHRVLFLGVLGALVFRGLFIAGGAVLIQNFSWVLYIFAAFLLWTGWKMIRERNVHLDPPSRRCSGSSAGSSR